MHRCFEIVLYIFFTGSQGYKGQKGAPGVVSRMSAFSVHRTSSMHASSGNEVITYNTYTINIGNDFNIGTGFFTCDIPGVYYFAYTIETEGDAMAAVQLMKNGELQNDLEAVRKEGSRQIMQSQSIILSLQQGDTVNLQLYSDGRLDDTNNKRNTFNGYLIYEH